MPQRISSQRKILSMSSTNPPAAYAKSGDTIIFETLDCFGGTITDESQLFNSVGWESINPATGPLYIEEAKAGDVLKIEILDIVVAPEGVIADAPGHGAMPDMVPNEATKIIPIVDGKGVFNEKIQFPIDPMIGVIGTAPKPGEDIPTGTPGFHGGNMDCKKITKGSVLYLPVYVDGALLSMGDLHAVMGDGEVIVCGLEICGEVTVRLTVQSDTGLPLPFLVNQEKVMTIYSAATLDEAAQKATIQMEEFLMEKIGLDFHEAGMLLSLLGDLRICQIVDPLMTVRMEFPKWVLEKYGFAI